MVVDARTNSLVVQGAAGRVKAVREYVELVDRPARSKSRVHVVRVVNVDAADLAEQLRTIATERAETRARAATLPRATTTATPGTTPAARPVTIVADAPTNTLLIAADGATFAELSDVISQLDVIPPRIAIEAWVWSVDTSRSHSTSASTRCYR